MSGFNLDKFNETINEFGKQIKSLFVKDETFSLYPPDYVRQNLSGNEGWVEKLLNGEAATAEIVLKVNESPEQYGVGEGRDREWWAAAKSYLEETEQKLSGFKITKDIEGNYRWFGWVTNKWLDRDKEIITDSAHREFLEYLDEHPQEAPELWTWHTMGTARKNKADWWDYADGFFMYSGILTEEEAKTYEKNPEPVGMSHGFYVYAKQGRFILKYRTFEVSDLFLDSAANPYTDFISIKEENEEKMFSTRKRQYLVQRFGEEKVSELERDTENRSKSLELLGVEWKEVSEAYEKELEAAQDARIAKASEANLREVVAGVTKALNLDGLREVLNGLNAKIESVAGLGKEVAELKEAVEYLKETEDTRMAKALAPEQPISWSLSVTSKSKEEKEEDLTEDEKKQVKEMKGQENWLQGLNPF